MNFEDKSILIDTFEAEAQDHLKCLNEGLLKLEQNPNDLELLGEMFRSAHSLKGAAKLLGFNQVSEQAHKAEDILSKINESETTFSSDSADNLFQIFDAIGSLVCHAVNETNKHSEDQKVQEKSPTDECDIKSEWEIKKIEKSVTDKESEKQKDQVKESINKEIRSTASTVARSKEVRVHTSKLDLIGSIASELSTLKKRPEDIRIDTKKYLGKFKELDKNWRDVKNNLIKLTHSTSSDTNNYMTLMSIVSVFENNYDVLKSDIVKVLKDSKNLAVAENLILKKLEKVAIELRMLPISTTLNLFPRTVRDLCKALNKKISITIEGSSVHLDKKILEKIKDPLTHLVRNAADHGIETPERRVQLGKPEEGNIKISVSRSGDSVLIVVEDDGAGINMDALREVAKKRGYNCGDVITEEELANIIFEQGVSTSKIITDISGRGVGMDVVKRNIDEIKGNIGIKSEKNKGTKFTIKVPLTITVSKILLVQVDGKSYAFPIDDIEGVVEAKKEQIKSSEGRKVLMVRDKTIPLISLRSVIGCNGKKSEDDEIRTIVLLSYNGMTVGCIVDVILSERDVVIKSFGKYLSNIPFITGAAPLSNDDGALVINVPDFLSKAFSLSATEPIFHKKNEVSQKKQKRILLVEDSLTTRELEKSILESCGYQVNTATDGMEGLKMAREEEIDIIVTDVEMPRMNGFQMIQKIKEDKRLNGLPVIIVTSLEKESEKKKGMEVGADAYIVKASFDQTNLINTIESLTR